MVIIGAAILKKISENFNKTSKEKALDSRQRIIKKGLRLLKKEVSDTIETMIERGYLVYDIIVSSVCSHLSDDDMAMKEAFDYFNKRYPDIKFTEEWTKCNNSYRTIRITLK